MTTIEQLLEAKGRTVHAIPPEATVYEAIRRMAEHDIGALVVERDGRLLGILSERDYARKVILRGRSSQSTQVSEALSWPVTIVRPDDTVDRCMELMTAHRVRHVPVMHQDRVVGIISIGDIVKSIIDEQQRTIAELGYTVEELQRYIYGDHPWVG